MKTSLSAGHRDNENSAGLPSSFQQPSSFRQASSFRKIGQSSDPSIVSLSVEDMQRLIDIERSAYLALSAMGTITMPNKSVTDAANALADALAHPALGG
ncbi:MAG: hypothetical protein JWM91_1815 [Rhodospirillales bacterium]|nr:hypothetical protein [Rhodospirillales bacterium]